ncbi:MAG: lyase family protein, partial [Saprospiraceae bacterium]
MLKAVSPIDGRYAKVTAPLVEYFSEYALIRNRVLIEVKYFEALCRLQLPQLSGAENHLDILRNVIENFSEDDALSIKDIEKITNHDVKAVEYFIKKKLDDSPLEPFKEFIHFGLTSQDINNTAQPLALLQANYLVLFPLIDRLIQTLEQKSKGWMNVSLLAFTHGQPASPTTLGKELYVFVARLQSQFEILKQIPITGKFGGATGNFNAHHVAYPDLDWHSFANEFVQSLGIVRIPWTTQIEPYDYLAA